MTITPSAGAARLVAALSAVLFLLFAPMTANGQTPSAQGAADQTLQALATLVSLHNDLTRDMEALNEQLAGAQSEAAARPSC